MAFTGDEGTVVTLAEAAEWTANYRKTIPEGDTIAHFVGKEKLLSILEQDDCVGIRFYYGKENDGAKNLIAVGANSAENDLIDGIIVERIIGCPTRCSEKNPLNS
jgi:hypothetical protein